MRRVLPICLCALTFAATATAIAATGPLKLPRPPFPAPAADPGTGRLELAIVSSRSNGISEATSWARANRLDLRLAGPGVAPSSYRGLRLVKAIRQRATVLAVYGRDHSSGRVLVALTPAGRVRYALDFGRYAYAPVTASGERAFVFQRIVWAAEAGGTLYVEHAHWTYASSSGGRNAYLTAVDLATGKVRWRSPALVANAGRFELAGGVIVTGYGFTREPDLLWVLDRRTGEPISRLPVPSAPDSIVRAGSRFHVHTYDHDLVVKLVRAS